MTVTDEWVKPPPCGRCGHSPDWHTLRSEQNVGPCDPEAKFRCYGHAPGASVGDDCDCPDYVKGDTP